MKIKRLVFLLSLMSQSFLLNADGASEMQKADTSEQQVVAAGSALTALELKLFLQPKTDQQEKGLEFELIRRDQERYTEALKRFVLDHYNQPGYAEKISQNGEHFGIIMEALKEFNLGCDPIPYVCTPLKLFGDKYLFPPLVSDGVTAYVLRVLLENMADYLKPIKMPSIGSIEQVLQEYIVQTITHHHREIAQDPGFLVMSLSKGFARSHLDAMEQYKVMLEDQAKLRGHILSLVQNMLSKTMWSKCSYQGAWDSFINLSHYLKRLHATGLVVDVDHYDSLKWLLLARFTDYLDLVGLILPLDFYEAIKEDVAAREVLMFEEAELDELIKSKRDIFLDALTGAEVKARAYQKGILADASISVGA